MPAQQQPGNQPQPQPQQTATGQATATATGNSGTDPNHPPDNSGKWFWSGTAHHWVDSTGQQDATGRYLTDEEKAYYDQQNHQRATYTAIRNSYGGGGGGDNPTASGLDYDNATGQWKYYDTKTKQWLAGTSLTDIYSTIFNDKQRSEHPLSYYENLQKNQDEQFDNDRQNRYRQAQSDALSSSPTTRYAPTRF